MSPSATFNIDDLEIESTEELLRQFFEPDAVDGVLGDVRLFNLPERLFREVVATHNRNVDRCLAEYEWDWEFRRQVEGLKITTFDQFQTLLDDTNDKKRVTPQYRKVGNFDAYREWVIRQPPISTDLRDKFFKKRYSAYVPRNRRQLHSFVVGASGSGKTEAIKLMILSTKQRADSNAKTGYPLVNRSETVVLIDPHGDLAQQCVRQKMYYADYLANHDDPDLIYVDPTLSRSRFITINPFDISHRVHSTTEIEKIAQQLTKVIDSLLGEGSLSANMEALLIPCITVLLRRRGSTLFDLVRFMNQSQNHDLVALGERSANRGHREFFRHSFSEKRFNPTKGAVTTKLHTLLNNEAFANFLALPHSTLVLENAINGGKTVVVNCAKGEVGLLTMEAIGRFMVGMILAIALNRSQTPEKARTPTWLFIDEAQNFVSPEIKVIMTEGRKFGAHLTLATQVVGQDMSPNLTKILLGNTEVQIVGKCGEDTRAKMGREMGLDPSAFLGLEAGQFVTTLTRGGKKPPVKIKMLSDHIGHMGCMNGDEWRELRTRIVDLYYQEPLDDPDSEDVRQIIDEEAQELPSSGRKPKLPQPDFFKEDEA